MPRRVRIMRSDLEQYGYTSGCPGCLTAQLQDGARRGPHTEECRTRMEDLIGGERVQQAQARIEKWAFEHNAAADPKPSDGIKEEARMEPGPIEEPPKVAEVVEDTEMQTADDANEEELQDAPGRDQVGRTRVQTPERTKATKRQSSTEAEPGSVRRRLEDDLDMGIPLSPGASSNMDAGGSPLQEWLDGNMSTPVAGSARMESDVSPGYAPTSPADSAMRDDSGGDIGAIFDALSDEDRSIVASVIRGVDVTEIYSPARVNTLAAKMGPIPGHSLDITNGWDFTKEEHRRKAWHLIKPTEPNMVIGSPPCTLFSMLQELNLHLHRGDGLDGLRPYSMLTFVCECISCS